MHVLTPPSTLLTAFKVSLKIFNLSRRANFYCKQLQRTPTQKLNPNWINPIDTHICCSYYPNTLCNTEQNRANCMDRSCYHSTLVLMKFGIAVVFCKHVSSFVPSEIKNVFSSLQINTNMETVKRCFIYQHTCCNDGIFFLALPCMYFTPFFACVFYFVELCVVFSLILPKSLKDANDAWKKLYTNTKYNSGKSI